MQAHDGLGAGPDTVLAQAVGRGHQRQAFVAAPGRANAEEAQCVDELLAGASVYAFFKGKRHQAVGAAEVAFPQRMAGVGGQRGIEHAADLGLALQPFGDLGRMALVLGQAHGQRAQAAQREIGVVGAHRQAQRFMRRGNLRGERRGVGDDNALHHVRMARDVLGRGVNGEVRAQRQRLVEPARAPGVVGRDRNAMGARHRRQRGQVQHFVEQRTRRLEIDQLGVWPDLRRQIVLRWREVFQRDPQALQQRVVDAAHGRVDAVGHQRMVAGRQQRHQHQRDRRHARRREESALAAFERGHRVFQRAVGVEAVAAVGGQAFARGAAVVQIGIGGAAFKAHGAGAHHGNVDRARAAAQIGCARMQQAGGTAQA